MTLLYWYPIEREGGERGREGERERERGREGERGRERGREGGREMREKETLKKESLSINFNT